MLPIILPYHSRFMAKASDKIRTFMEGVSIQPPSVPIVSCVNQKVLSTAQDIRDELRCNVSDKINWLKTMQRMLELGVNLFVECGMSKSLTQLAKFIGGEYTVINITNVSKRLGGQN
jgi:[acyl-carrier-protein] S-malonyltransferase